MPSPRLAHLCLRQVGEPALGLEDQAGRPGLAHNQLQLVGQHNRANSVGRGVRQS